jgi:hypothetical protein
MRNLKVGSPSRMWGIGRLFTKKTELDTDRFLKILSFHTPPFWKFKPCYESHFLFFSSVHSLFLPPHTSDIMATVLRLNEKSSKDILLLHKYVKSSIPVEFSKDVNLEVSNVNGPLLFPNPLSVGRWQTHWWSCYHCQVHCVPNRAWFVGWKQAGTDLGKIQREDQIKKWLNCVYLIFFFLSQVEDWLAFIVLSLRSAAKKDVIANMEVSR